MVSILKSNHAGDPLEAERFDSDQIADAIEVLRHQMTAASDLALETLSETELGKKIADLRAIQLPEIKKLRFSRESSYQEFKEVVQ